MGPAFSWLLALRYLTSRWVNVLGVVGVAVAVWALIVVRAVFSGFIADIRADVRRSAPDLLVTSLPHDTDYRPLAAALQAEPDVEAVAPRLRHYGVFFQRTGRALPAQSSEIQFSNVGNNFVQLLGIDPALEAAVVPVPDWLARGRARRFDDGADHAAPELRSELRVPDEVEYAGRERAGLPVPARPEEWRARWPGFLVGRERGKNLFWLQVGDPIDVLSVDFGPAGAGDGAPAVRNSKPVFAYAGIFDTGHGLFDETTALVPIESLRTMLGQHASSSDSIALVTDVAVRARPGLDEASLRALAARLLPAVQRALPPGSSPEVLTWEQQNAVFLGAVDLERAMMAIVLFVVMLIAAFLIYATLNMMVTQKVKDIGILTALGGAPAAVGAIFTRCGFVLGALGGSLGMAAGILTAVYLDALDKWMLRLFGFELFPAEMFDLPQIPYQLEPSWIAMVAVAALALALLVSWRPSRRAARMHPVQALSYE